MGAGPRKFLQSKSGLITVVNHVAKGAGQAWGRDIIIAATARVTETLAYDIYG